MRKADLNRLKKATEHIKKAKELLTQTRESLERQPYEKYDDEMTTEKFIGLKEDDIKFEADVLENACRKLTDRAEGKE